MKKIVIFLLFLLAFSSIVFALPGNTPEISAATTYYENKLHNPIPKAYFKGETILVNATIKDLDGCNDIKKVYLIINYSKNYTSTLDCSKKTGSCINNASSNESNYTCSLTITNFLKGNSTISLKVVDKSELTAESFIGNYYFNPKTALSNSEIIFKDPFISGNVSYTDWINVNINTPADNPYSVYLYGKDLYASKGKRARCPKTNVLSLGNFQYTINNGSTWNPIPSKKQKQKLFDFNGTNGFLIKFKVDIPVPCYGDYTTNSTESKNIVITLDK